MSRKVDQRLLDINAMVMGGGVGLAALESMFNLVQTQSLLSASMVRDHDANHVLALEALSLAIREMGDAGVRPACRRCRRSRTVDIDIPENKGCPAAAPAEPDPTLEHLVVEMLDLLGGHMKELNDGYRESNRRNLLVT